MKVKQAIERVLLGESLKMLAADCRTEMVESVGLDPKDVAADLFVRETNNFMKKVARELGERHGDDRRAMIALRDWVREVDDYEAWDALLTHFDFEGRDTLVRRGRVLFAGPMTAHWS